MLSENAKYLVFDTETTGLFKEFAISKAIADAPYIVQLSYEILDAQCNLLYSSNVIINNNICIPDRPASIHGITTAIATEKGISPGKAIYDFIDACAICDTLVAHNINFDMQMLYVHILRYCTAAKDNLLSVLLNKRLICTSTAFANYNRQLRSDRNLFDFVNLGNAVALISGKYTANLHDATVDVSACAKILKFLVDSDVVTNVHDFSNTTLTFNVIESTISMCMIKGTKFEHKIYQFKLEDYIDFAGKLICNAKTILAPNKQSLSALIALYSKSHAHLPFLFNHQILAANEANDVDAIILCNAHRTFVARGDNATASYHSQPQLHF